MNIKYEKMLFYNDLLEYQVSIEGKRVDNAFKLDGNQSSGAIFAEILSLNY